MSIQKSSNIYLLISMVFLVLSACSPVSGITSVPMAVITVYDQQKKRERWEEYAKEGDVYSQYELATSYCCRRFEGEPDYAKAVFWFCAAARNGFAKAQFEVGRLYEAEIHYEGISIPVDKVRAYMWYELATRRGNEQARKHRENLENILTPDEIAAAEAQLRNYKEVACGVGQ